MKLKYFDIAKRQALKSNHNDFKHGAVIIKKNRVLAVGYNQNKTHTRSLHSHRHIHAEMAAAFKLSLKALENATIYVWRAHHDGSNAMSRPCPSCLKILTQVGIKRMVYSTNQGYAEEFIE